MNHYIVLIETEQRRAESLKQAEQDALARVATQQGTPARKLWRIRLPLHLFVIEIYHPQAAPTQG
jgi:hypothetical protein